jgi:hypothetical protein
MASNRGAGVVAGPVTSRIRRGADLRWSILSDAPRRHVSGDSDGGRSNRTADRARSGLDDGRKASGVRDERIAAASLRCWFTPGGWHRATHDRRGRAIASRSRRDVFREGTGRHLRRLSSQPFGLPRRRSRGAPIECARVLGCQGAWVLRVPGARCLSAKGAKCQGCEVPRVQRHKGTLAP